MKGTAADAMKRAAIQHIRKTAKLNDKQEHDSPEGEAASAVEQGITQPIMVLTDSRTANAVITHWKRSAQKKKAAARRDAAAESSTPAPTEEEINDGLNHEAAQPPAKASGLNRTQQAPQEAKKANQSAWARPMNSAPGRPLEAHTEPPGKTPLPTNRIKADAPNLKKHMTQQGRKLAQKSASQKAATSATSGANKAIAMRAAVKAAARDGSQAVIKAVTSLPIPVLIFSLLFLAVIGVSTLFILCTSFGIFVAGDNGIRDVISVINQEYEQQIADIRQSVEHDDLDMSGAQSDWRTVLAVYAVKCGADPEAPSEVVTMDMAKEALLREIFWEMNNISWRTETYEIPTPEVTDPTEPEPSDPAEPPEPTNPIRPRPPIEIEPMQADLLTITETEPSMIEQTRLLIVVSHQTAEAMAALYQFTDAQKQMLEELLLPQNLILWNDVLYGISTGGNGDIVAVAASQVGNYNGNPYWSWWGYTSRVEWCAIFISWCAEQCGYLDEGIIPKFENCPWGSEWFKAQGRWQPNGYTPAPGEIIFFDWDRDNSCDHVGIVEYVADGFVHTIEGNSGNACKRNSYSITDYRIYGYGIPDYGSLAAEDPIVETTDVLLSAYRNKADHRFAP